MHQNSAAPTVPNPKHSENQRSYQEILEKLAGGRRNQSKRDDIAEHRTARRARDAVLVSPAPKRSSFLDVLKHLAGHHPRDTRMPRKAEPGEAHPDELEVPNLGSLWLRKQRYRREWRRDEREVRRIHVQFEKRLRRCRHETSINDQRHVELLIFRP